VLIAATDSRSGAPSSSSSSSSGRREAKEKRVFVVVAVGTPVVLGMFDPAN
jgi:hypothetical protein